MIVYPRQKRVEIEQQLFNIPSPLMLTYLHKLTKQNYTIQLVLMKAKNDKVEKQETGVAIPTGIITSEELVEKFVNVKKHLPELDKTTANLKVISDDTLVVATNNLSQVMGFIKEVDATRSILKKPYLDTGRMIDQYCKGMDDMLQRFKTRLASEITNWKTLKEAEERQKQAKRLKELEVVETDKREESTLLTRIEKQLNARLYGGVYYTKSGERKSSAGCIKSDDCVTLHKILNESIPQVDAFKHFPDRYEEMIRKLAKRISEHQTNLIDVEGVADFARTVALERIAQARAEAEVESLDNEESIGRQINREIRKEEIKTEKAVENAGKGVRQTLKYKVLEEDKVSRDFFSVDHDKIMKYLNENRDKIKGDLQQNAETIPGIRFYVEDTFIAR